MSKSPVMTVTDELIAELEIFALYGKGTDSGIKASEIEALLAERAELKRDAKQAYLRGLVDQKANFERAYSSTSCWNMCEGKTSDGLRAMDSAIDAAMESEK